MFCEEEGENIEELFLGFCRSKTKFLADRFPGVFSDPFIFGVLAEFVVQTLIALYFLHKCRDVVGVACCHFQITCGNPSGAS